MLPVKQCPWLSGAIKKFCTLIIWGSLDLTIFIKGEGQRQLVWERSKVQTFALRVAVIMFKEPIAQKADSIVLS